MITAKTEKAVLTNGGIVTADSIYTGSTGYANCLSGLIDGKFIGDPSLVGNAPYKCCAHNLCTSNGWMNI